MTPATLKALLASATPGPWRANRTHDLWMEIYTGHGLEQRMIADCLREADAVIFVALHNAAPALLACAEALREYLEWGAMTGSDRELFRAKFENRLKALEDA